MSVVRRLSGSGGKAKADPGERYRAIFQTMSEGFVVCEVIRDASGRVVDCWIRDANPAFARRVPGVVGRRLLEVRPQTPARWFSACHVALTRGKPVRFEFYDEDVKRWYDMQITRLSDNEVGQFLFDITDRKRAESNQAQLFDELNHRVKNNLTIVSGLLTMQARHSGDPQVRDQLLKAVDRIQSIADLHALLYRGKRKDEVAARGYLEDLCARLARTLLEGREVRLDLHADPIHLPIDEAVRLGVIVNELVTNAAKHAFAANAPGVIQVRLTRSDRKLSLVVADSGRGMGAPAAAGLGLRLVRSLVQRDGGELVVDTSQGTRLEVRLPFGEAGAAEPTQDSFL